MAKPTGRPAGRPRKYESPDVFDAKVDEFVELCKANDEPVSWTGMALHLGFYGRAEMDNYAEYDGFSNSVKRAKAIVERSYEVGTAKGVIPAAMGIFALKNMKWTDRQELDHTSSDGSMSLTQRLQRGRSRAQDEE